MRLVLTDVLRTELVGRALEVMREIFDCLDVEACCSLSVITTLEFLEHHFAKVGHRLSPYDPTLFPSTPLLPTPSTRKRPPPSGFVQTALWEVNRRKRRSSEQCSLVKKGAVGRPAP